MTTRVRSLRHLLQPNARFYRPQEYFAVLALAVSIPFVAAFAASRWLSPIDTAAAKAVIYRPRVVAFQSAAAEEWRETVRRAAAARTPAAIDQVLPLVPLLGSDVGGEAAMVVSGLAARWRQPTEPELLAARDALGGLANTHLQSLPLQYALAAVEWRRGNGVEARRILDRYLQRAAPQEIWAAAGTSEPQVARIVLFNYLAGRAALSAGRADTAVDSFRIAIRSTNALDSIAGLSDARNYRVMRLFSGNAASALADPGDANDFTSLSLYDSLIAAYWRADGFKNPPEFRGREFARRRADIASGSVLVKLLEASVPWNGSPWSNQPIAGNDFRLPEHLVWALSNLQRLRHANGPDLTANHLVLEAAFLRDLADRQPWPLPSSSVTADQVRRASAEALDAAWRKLAADSPPAAEQAVAAAMWSDAHVTERAGVFAALPIATLRAVQTHAPASAPLAIVARATGLREAWQGATRAGGAGDPIDTVETILRYGIDPARPQQPAYPPADLAWLRQWYGAALHDIGVALLDTAAKDRTIDTEKTRAQAEDLLAAFDWLARHGGFSRFAALNIDRQQWPYTDRGLKFQALVGDQWQAVVVLVFVGAAFAGARLWRWYLAWRRHTALVQPSTLNADALVS